MDKIYTLAFNSIAGNTSVAILCNNVILTYSGFEDYQNRYYDNSLQDQIFSTDYANKFSAKNICSEKLINLIELSLAKANITYKQLDYIATIVGPGSFTGIRASLSAARAILLITSQARSIGLTTFEPLNRSAKRQISKFDFNINISNAFGGQVYVQTFDYLGKVLQLDEDAMSYVLSGATKNFGGYLEIDPILEYEKIKSSIYLLDTIGQLERYLEIFQNGVKVFTGDGSMANYALLNIFKDSIFLPKTIIPNARDIGLVAYKKRSMFRADIDVKQNLGLELEALYVKNPYD